MTMAVVPCREESSHHATTAVIVTLSCQPLHVHLAACCCCDTLVRAAGWPDRTTQYNSPAPVGW
jgi:hypothetical protein